MSPSLDKFHFQTIDDAVKLVDKGYYLATIALRHAYRSVSIHPSNYPATGLKWTFSGDNSPTHLYDTRLCFGGRIRFVPLLLSFASLRSSLRIYSGGRIY